MFKGSKVLVVSGLGEKPLHDFGFNLRRRGPSRCCTSKTAERVVVVITHTESGKIHKGVLPA
jgi:hypothetical protein